MNYIQHGIILTSLIKRGFLFWSDSPTGRGNRFKPCQVSVRIRPGLRRISRELAYHSDLGSDVCGFESHLMHNGWLNHSRSKWNGLENRRSLKTACEFESYAIRKGDRFFGETGSVKPHIGSSMLSYPTNGE